jgi:hypothetical protein
MHHGQAKLEGFLTWNSFKPRYAPLEAARQFLLRKMGCQGARLWRVGEADFTP